MKFRWQVLWIRKGSCVDYYECFMKNDFHAAQKWVVRKRTERRPLIGAAGDGGRGYPKSTDGTAVSCGCRCSHGGQAHVRAAVADAVSPSSSNVTRDLDSLLCLPTYCYSLPPFALLCPPLTPFPLGGACPLLVSLYALSSAETAITCASLGPAGPGPSSISAGCQP